jgi:hypothetical protein
VQSYAIHGETERHGETLIYHGGFDAANDWVWMLVA